MKMIFFRKREWQRLLTAVVMLLALGQYAGAQQITLQVIDAGFSDEGKWWVDLKNPSNENLSNATAGNDAKKKLGICFYIETAGGETTTNNATTMRWNDEETWSINAGETKRFTENGGRDNNMDGLTNGNTYYLNIKIQDAESNNIKEKINSVWANATFVYGGKENGVNKISAFTKLSGFVVPEGTGTQLAPGTIYNLVQGTKYTFTTGYGFATTWSEAKAAGNKTYTFGWFDNKGTFLGVSGSYEIKAATDRRAEYAHLYYDIIPVANSGASAVQDKYKHLEYDKSDALKLDGSGALYLGGSKNGFGIPTPNGTYGWDGPTDEVNAEIKGSAIPQIENGKYRFDITTGDQVNAWGEGSEPLLFKVFHYKRWNLPIEKSDKTFSGFEFKRLSVDGEVPDANKWTDKYNDISYRQTYYHVEKNTELSPLGGMFEVTNSYDPALGNGNIHGIAIGQDSDLPKFPNGYTFRFVLDLTKNTWNFPLSVSLESRPADADVDGTDTWHATDKVNKTGNVGDITVNLNNINKDKRISLRDAFRLDWNIPYKNSNPRGEDEKNLISIKTLKVKGFLSVNDLYYLGDLIVRGKITELDLSNATIDGDKIPAGFAAKGENDPSKLTTIKLPANTIIGSEAFKNCRELVNVEFVGESSSTAMVGAGAFWGCKKLSNETINKIIAHTQNIIMENTFRETNATDITIPNTITEIQANAFAECKLLKKVQIPATFKGKESEITTYEDWIMPGEIGKVYVGSNDVYAARKARTLSDTNNAEITLEGEDFNQTQGVGWFNNGDNGERKEDEIVTSTYRSDIDTNNLTFGIGKEKNGDNYKLGWMHPNYWFNYSFRVTSKGSYKITAKMATGNNAKNPAFAIDGGQSISVSVQQSGWEPWNNNEIEIAYVDLKPGIHYITFYGDEGTDLDKMIISRVENIPNGKTVITPGYLSGDVVTVYELKDGDDSKQPAMKTHKDAFNGVEPNDCEVVFGTLTLEDGTETDMLDEMVAAYRDKENNAGILKLLTKTVSEDTPYNVVYQKHADVKATRTFKTKKWNSVVFPFTVNGKILKNATSEDGSLSEPFARAACLYDNNYGDPDFNDVKMRFVYLDNEYSFQEDGTEKIVAGTPFLLYVDGSKNAPANNVYVFKDVDTPAASTSVGLGYEDAKVIKMADPAGDNGITDYSFVGRVNYNKGDAAFTNKIYWVADSKYYWGTNVTMKNMRSWFEPKTDSGARAIENLFGFVNDETTGISIVGADNNSNANGGIYSVSGRLISNDASSLSRLAKGVYIVNGKKVVVK